MYPMILELLPISLPYERTVSKSIIFGEMKNYGELVVLEW
jgi:hypothetical protein